MRLPIVYEEPVYRPPSEGRSFLLQVTIGCSHNLCTYCNMYRDKSYRERSLEEVTADIDSAVDYFERVGHSPKRAFLCDGDALGASMDLLLPTLEHLNLRLPGLERVSVYATAQNMLDRTESELEALAKLKLTLAYLGLESGSNKVLKFIVKGNTAADMIEGCAKVRSAGMGLSIIAMLGVGGVEHTAEHRVETASIISKIAPEYFSFLTTVSVPGTPYHALLEKGTRLAPLTIHELLCEMRDTLQDIDPGDREILFRANHVSNQYPIGGVLKRDTPQIIDTLAEWISACPEGVYPEPRLSSL